MLSFLLLFIHAKTSDIDTLLSEVSNLQETVSHLTTVAENEIFSYSLSTLHQSLIELRQTINQLYSVSTTLLHPRNSRNIGPNDLYSYFSPHPFHTYNCTVSLIDVYNKHIHQNAGRRGYNQPRPVTTHFPNAFFDLGTGSIFLPPIYTNASRHFNSYYLQQKRRPIVNGRAQWLGGGGMDI